MPIDVKSLLASFFLRSEIKLFFRMKTLKMNQFDDKEEEIADALIYSGMSRNVSMIN